MLDTTILTSKESVVDHNEQQVHTVQNYTELSSHQSDVSAEQWGKRVA